ncbi:MAG: cellulase family glycosylhydrolase [Bacteroidales bacterium]
MKKNVLLLSLFLVFSQALYSQIDGYVNYHGQLSINGSKIVNQYDDTVSFAGPSLFWSNTWWGGDQFYNENVVTEVAQNWDASIIRAAMGVEENGGYLTSDQNKTANYDRVTTVIDAAIANDIYVIVDWHSHNAENYEAEAIEFFSKIAQEYGNNPNIIYELYNEPLDVSWSTVIKPYAKAVIAEIRKYDPNNIIVVGTPIWSQKVDDAAVDPITAYENIAYTAHFYAGTHTQWLRDRIEAAMNSGIAVIITEWGTVDADGDGGVDEKSSDDWVDFMAEHDITHCNWALNNKDEGASALESWASTQGGWTDNDLTTSGTYVYNLIQNWTGHNYSVDTIPDDTSDNNDGDTSSDQDTVTQDTTDNPTMFDDNPIVQKPVVYTNAAGNIVISLQEPIFENASYSVYSAKGQTLIHNKSIRQADTEIVLQRNVPGIYVVRVKLANFVYNFTTIKK